MDAGDILRQERYPIAPDATSAVLHDKLADLGAELLLETIEDIRNDCVSRTAQDEAEAVEIRSKERQQRIHEREDLETRLREFSAGATVEALIAEAELVEADSIAPELERLAEEIEAIETERSELDQTIGTEKAELKRMDGSAVAAGHAE